ncbi:DNA-binding transcriptional regulator, XRE-family HTH domain [Mucilaginibacter pineti]|uniref:DNA-binding transcriptional regulator, XRE-family HTH domain n=1 Tax=Mucilaginibacter pineti TaxID=1391627 RepID=A0A1G7P504_9SPHI|nr:helix-turn-helix transcriptional regulator [Mucilaginibacter pineti]SDF80520.1 DNA-binding transcriptional regulator, XRE-family HTH domain [Mucilaginibacter pineti]
MELAQKKHFGQNIRNMRILKGMKQDTLGKVMGMAQQNISKMEKNELPTQEILERAAKAMGTTVDAIKNFDKDNDFNFFFGYTTNQHNHPIKEVIEYFKEAILKEHGEKEELKVENEALKAELDQLKKGNSKPESENKLKKVK